MSIFQVNNVAISLFVLKLTRSLNFRS